MALPAYCADPLVMVLVGPPGSGKSTQSDYFAKRHAIPGIIASDLLREEIATGSALGKSLQENMSRGELVGDAIINDLLRKRAGKPDAARGFILDGYPRTRAQAENLDALLRELGLPTATIISLEVPDDVVIARLTARGRPDDQPDVIRRRLDRFHKEASPILEYYGRRVRKINGNQPPPAVTRAVEEAVSTKL